VRITILSKLILPALIGSSVILFMVIACRQDKGTPLTMNRDLPPAALEAGLDRGEAVLGDRVTYTLTLSHIPEITAALPEIAAAPEGLAPVDSGHSGPRTERGRVSEKRWITYRVDRIGVSIFPAVKMRYHQNGADKELETQAIALQVKSVLTQEMKDIHGIKPLEEPKRDPRLMLAAAALAAALIALAFGAWFWWKKRKKPVPIHPPLPPHLEAEQGLRELNAMGLIARGDFRTYYFILSGIFRTYLEQRFEFPAVERTTEEILANLGALTVTETLRDEVRTFLGNTEPVKFAGVGSSMDNANRETERVRNFVKVTGRQTAAAPAPVREKEHVAV
jgi:hypothetical protein